MMRYLTHIIFLAAISAATTLVSASESEFTLDPERYEVLVGDYDGDGSEDIYLQARGEQKVIVISLPDYYVIPFDDFPPTGDLILKQMPGGGYQLITDPDSQTLVSIDWTPGTAFQLINGDFNGDGRLDTLLYSADQSAPSFILLAGDTARGTALSQVITQASVGNQFGGGPIRIVDINGDGNDDIVFNYETDDQVVFTSTPSGEIEAVNDDADEFQPEADPNVYSDGVGAIPGDFFVNASGKPNYSIAFRMPPSVANIAPVLSFTYSGQSNDGILGVGWYIAGLSEITRCATQLDRDDYVDGVNFNDSDKYCLNGQRLVVVSGGYGDPGAEYRTENESYAKIVGHGDSFTVWRATGEIEIYGGTAQSRQSDSANTHRVKWKISKRQDREGNYVEYDYSADLSKGTHYIKEIRYTGNQTAGLTPQNKVVFSYEDRNDVTPSYRNSYRNVFDKRLDGIAFFIKDEKVREYFLDYQYGASTGKSQLQQITDCGISAGRAYCLPATEFGWGAFSNIIDFNYQVESVDSTVPSSHQYTNQQYQLADVNGDGRSDIVWTYRDVNKLGIVLYQAKADGQGFEREYAHEETGFLAANIDDAEQTFLTGDFNGDGRADLVYVARYLNDVYRNIYLSVIDNGRTKFVDQGYQVDSDNEYSHLELAEFRVGDINADGRSDLLWIFGKASSFGVTTYLANASTNGQVYLGKTETMLEVGEYSPARYNNHHFLVNDVNGDGKSDLVWGFTVNNYLYRIIYLADAGGDRFYRVSVERDGDIFSSDQELENAQFHSGDINGDGKTDLVWTWIRFGELQRTLYLSAEQGNRFVKQGTQSDRLDFAAIDAHEYQQTLLSDFNADGRSDLIYIYHQNDKFGWVSLTADAGANKFTLADKKEIAGIAAPVFQNHRYLFGDVTLDGRPDLIWAFNHSTSGANYQRLFVLPQAYPDHIDKITDGLGVETKIDYAYLADPAQNIYTHDHVAQYPLREDSGLSFVVKTIRQSNGVGGDNVFDYRYRGARTHLRGRGFVGFKERIVTDHQSGFVRAERYEQQFPLISNLQSSVTHNPNTGLAVRKNFNHWRSADVSWSGKVTQAPYLADAVTIQYELDGGEISTTLIRNNFDNQTGNLTQKRRVVGYGFDGAIDGHYQPNGSYTDTNVLNRQLTVVADNRFLSDLGGNWRPGFLQKETQTFQSHQGSPDRVIVNEFVPYGPSSYLHGEEHRFVGTGVWVKNHYHRDGFGNVVRVDITAGDIDNGQVGPYRETMGPYVDGLYPEVTRNHLQHAEHALYDGRIGEKQRITDANNLTTFQFYDDFGRSIITRNVSAAVTTSVYENCVNCASHSRYRVTTTTEHPNEETPGAATEIVYYDQLNRVVQRDVTGFDGRLVRTTTEYDDRGRMIAESEPYFVGDTVLLRHLEYDDLDRVTLERQADGGRIQNIYSTDSNYPDFRNRYQQRVTVKKTGRNAFEKTLITQQWSNALAQIRRSEDAESIVTDVEYDVQSNITLARVNADSGTDIEAETDVAGNKTRLIDPNMGETLFEYDGRGLLRRKTQKSAIETHRVTSIYDAIGRLIQRRDDNNGVLIANATWRFDTAYRGIGLLASKTAEGFAESYHYDNYSRLSNVETSLSGANATREFHFRYDGYGRELVIPPPQSGGLGSCEQPQGLPVLKVCSLVKTPRYRQSLSRSTVPDFGYRF